VKTGNLMTSLCVHGHFYQPPREDPISGVIPDEAGSLPFRNWNEKIDAECYSPNAEAGNFERISFNIGPTLFNWLELNDPDTYHLILSQEHNVFTKWGVSNAIAQSYNHSILPLASYRDKKNQIKWGIADYTYRFGHAPEGIWLPETAVDLETLQICSDEGIKFTILAPWQKEESLTNNDALYQVKLPGKRDPFIVFLYDQPLSTAVSFNPIETMNGDLFLEKILNESSEGFRMIASDGELYGHHQQFRDKFLTYITTEGAENHNLALTFPALWLQSHQPEATAKIQSNTSWSCFHGVERWRKECGCTPGAHWKMPLRVALDSIGQDIDQIYENWGNEYVEDVWQLRNDFIHFVLREISKDELYKQHLRRKMNSSQERTLDLLLMAQFDRQKMFNSCGWFFEEFHRIEPQNNIAFCAKSVWLTEKASGIDLYQKSIDLLKNVRSEKTGLRGDTVFSQTWIRLDDQISIE